MTHVMRIAFVALCLFGASPSFAQAGGEVVDVKVTHVVSSIGAPTPPDEIQQLRLRVVDARGHEFTAAFGSDATSACANLLNPRSGRVDYCSTELKGPDAARRWLAGGEERRLLLIDLYISMFQQLDEGVARGRIASTNARIDPSKAQGYVTLADIAAVVKARTAKAEAQQAESAAKDEQARAAISKPKLLPIPEPVIADPAGRSTEWGLGVRSGRVRRAPRRVTVGATKGVDRCRCRRSSKTRRAPRGPWGRSRITARSRTGAAVASRGRRR